jgi:hypothetical protein
LKVYGGFNGKSYIKNESYSLVIRVEKW